MSITTSLYDWSFLDSHLTYDQNPRSNAEPQRVETSSAISAEVHHAIHQPHGPVPPTTVKSLANTKAFKLDYIFKEQGARKTKNFRYTILRPEVRAVNRLRDWSSSYYVKNYHTTPIIGLSRRTLDNVEEVLLAGLKDSTKQDYAGGLLRFHQFCDEHSISEDDRVPASEVLIQAWISDMGAGIVSPKTVQNWLAGVKFWHAKERAPWHGNNIGVSLTLKGITKLTPSSSKRPPRPPVTIAHMHSLVRKLDFNNSFDIAVWATATTAFWGCCRLGELLISSRNRFDNRYQASKNVVNEFKSTAAHNHAYATLHIPWSKTTHFQGAVIVLTEDARTPLCPVAALRLHKSKNGISSSPDLPFFAYIAPSEPEGWAPLTKDWFLSKCNQIWRVDGLAEVTGHSFRIGGATEYLLQGIPPAIVQRAGRWESDAFLLYWRKLEEIIPTFMNLSHSDSRFTALTATLQASAGSRGKK